MMGLLHRHTGCTAHHLDGSALANAGSQTNNSVVHSAFLKEGAMTDDGVKNFGVHNLGGRQKAWGCVDGRLRIVELKLGWLHTKQADENICLNAT